MITIGLLVALTALPGAPAAATPARPAHSAPHAVAERAPLPRVLHPGTRGPDVKALQLRLRQLKYDPGRANGRYGAETRAAVWAFRKANGLPAGDVGVKTRWYLKHPKRIRPLVGNTARKRVEIDLRRQLLIVWKNRRPALITHIATGTGRHYCDNGHCGVARTPRGDFRAYRKVRGWHDGPLGSLYFPTYFNGGIAMHGSLRVPAHRASHGCVRIPMHTALKLYRTVPRGTPVHVR